MDEETSKDALLIGAGVALASAATVFYRRKQTRAFKIAYFRTWPTLGSAVLVACMPDHDEMAEVRWLWDRKCGGRQQMGFQIVSCGICHCL